MNILTIDLGNCLGWVLLVLSLPLGGERSMMGMRNPPPLVAFARNLAVATDSTAAAE